MLQVAFLFVLLFGLLVAVVAVQNTTPVTLRVLVFEFPNVALSVLVLVSIAVGAFLTLLLGLGSWLGHRREVRQRDQRIASLESELARERAVHPAPAEEPLAPFASRLPDEPDSAFETRPRESERPYSSP